MEESAFLPLPEGMSIDHVQQSDSQLTLVVSSTSASAPCPGCGRFSEHVHSRYQRTVKDLPCGGRCVLLRLCVRKFFCLTFTCQGKVFGSTPAYAGPSLGAGHQSPGGGKDQPLGLQPQLK